MVDLYTKLEQVREEERSILGQIDIMNKNKTIECAACGQSYRIGDLTAVQKYWYEEPSGCTGGDQWHEGELQFICPGDDVVNRLLFDQIPYEDRGKFDKNPEMQFKRAYKGLFAKVVDMRGEKLPNGWVNNHYVNNNREEFHLVAKEE